MLDKFLRERGKHIIAVMVVHSDIKVGEKKKYHYKSVIQLV